MNHQPALWNYSYALAMSLGNASGVLNAQVDNIIRAHDCTRVSVAMKFAREEALSPNHLTSHRFQLT
jgi:hypothetical protein